MTALLIAEVEHTSARSCSRAGARPGQRGGRLLLREAGTDRSLPPDR
ncbi:hypothetical protein [Nocardiopsis salina]|nr:hypothetical protein [Nocardiopsis salina]